VCFFYCIKQIDSKLPYVCSVNRSQRTSKCGNITKLHYYPHRRSTTVSLETFTLYTYILNCYVRQPAEYSWRNFYSCGETIGLKIQSNAWGNYWILYHKTNEEDSTVLWFVVKHVGSSREVVKNTQLRLVFNSPTLASCSTASCTLYIYILHGISR